MTIASVLLAIGNIGCVHHSAASKPENGTSFTVSLPPLKLADGENIQSVEVKIFGGRIVSINRTWDDWNIEMYWDTPDNQIIKCEAGHFVSGVFTTHKFDRFITVEPKMDFPELPSIDISATVTTDGSGSGGREHHISRSEFILNPKPSAAIWRTRDPFFPGNKPGLYCVQWGYSATEIAAHFHISIGRLSVLNPGVNLANLKVGQMLYVSEPPSR